MVEWFVLLPYNQPVTGLNPGSDCCCSFRFCLQERPPNDEIQPQAFPASCHHFLLHCLISSDSVQPGSVDSVLVPFLSVWVLHLPWSNTDLLPFFFLFFKGLNIHRAYGTAAAAAIIRFNPTHSLF